MDFVDKNVLIIGGSSGIGLALVKQLHTAGATIYNASRHRSSEWPDDINHLELDVSGDTTSLSASLPMELHGLIYCVGSINLKPFQRLTKEDFLNDYRLNVVGAADVIQQSLKALRASQQASVVLFSTVAAKAGMGFHASVAAAKGGVEGLAIFLAAELAANHIRVNVIAPSLTDTPLAANLLNTPEKREASNKRHPLGKIGTPDDIANAVKFLLSDHSAWITGQVLGVDGGLSALRSL